MVFNVGAIPVAVADLVVGVSVWIFRVRLTQLSDRSIGRVRTLAEQERFSRLAIFPLVLSVVLALLVLLVPFR